MSGFVEVCSIVAAELNPHEQERAAIQTACLQGVSGYLPLHFHLRTSFKEQPPAAAI